MSLWFETPRQRRLVTEALSKLTQYSWRQGKKTFESDLKMSIKKRQETSHSKCNLVLSKLDEKREGLMWQICVQNINTGDVCKVLYSLLLVW